VPEEKEADEFIRLLQGAAWLRTQLRRLTARHRAERISLRNAMPENKRMGRISTQIFLKINDCRGSSTWET
jgi:uncharacterized protein with von Willebrand factor type A (vWA) domain